MSEQVGASLVLAQIIIPAAGAPPSASVTQPGSRLPQTSVEQNQDAAQPFVITYESAATFASLLTELATLEVQDAAGSAPLDDTLIRIRIDTDPGRSGAIAGGNRPPGGGNRPPAGGNADTASGMILPLAPEPPLQMLPGTALAEPESLPGVTPALAQEAGVREGAAAEEPIIVAEPRRAATAPQPFTDPPAPAELSRTATPPVTPSERPVVESVAGSRPPGQSVNNAPTGIAVDADAASEQGSDAGGRQSNQQSTARGTQGPPDRSSNGGPSISFSHDASGAAPSAAALLGASSPATTAPGILSQTLALTGQPGTWAGPLAERLAGIAASWRTIAARGMNTADVRLHPPSLGQLEVRITISNDQASIWLTSPNADVREALQQALPRLDGLLNNLGIELAEAQVSDRQPQAFDHDGGRQEAATEIADTTEETAGQVTDPSRLGILDTWA